MKRRAPGTILKSLNGQILIFGRCACQNNRAAGTFRCPGSAFRRLAFFAREITPQTDAPPTGFAACGKLYKTRTGRGDARSGFGAHFKRGPRNKKLPICLAGIAFSGFGRLVGGYSQIGNPSTRTPARRPRSTARQAKQTCACNFGMSNVAT